MASYLDKTGLTTLWGKVKSYAAPIVHTHEGIYHEGGGSLTVSMNQTPIIWGRYNGITNWSLERNGSDTINCLSVHYYNSEGGWVTSGNILDHANFTTYVTPGAIGAPTLTGAGASGTWGINISGTATYATHDNFGVALHLHMKSGGILKQTDLNEAYGAARWYWIHEPTANNYEFAYGSMLTFGDNPYNQIVLAYHSDTIAPTLRWRTRVNNVWQPWSVALDNHNYNLFALPLSGGTLTGSLTIPSNNKLTVYQVDFGNAYLYTNSNASFLGRTGPSTAYHYFQFNGSDGNLYIDGNKALHAANFTQHAISRWGDTMAGALNFKNATLNNLGDDCAFGDQDIAGAFCIKGLNGITTLALLPYEGSTIVKLSSGGGGWVSLAGATTFSVGREVMVNGDAYPVFTLANGSGTALGAFGTYTGNGSYGNNYIRTYNSSGYHDYVFDMNGAFHSKLLVLEGTTNPHVQINNGSGTYYLQGYLTNLYLGPGVSKGIAIDANGNVCRARNWTRFLSTVSWDGSTLTIEDS